MKLKFRSFEFNRHGRIKTVNEHEVEEVLAKVAMMKNQLTGVIQQCDALQLGISLEE